MKTKLIQIKNFCYNLTVNYCNKQFHYINIDIICDITSDILSDVKPNIISDINKDIIPVKST